MYAVLYFPQFPLQAVLRHEPARWQDPVALVDPGMTVPRVMEATASARAAGVTDGLTAPQALARCKTVVIRHRAPVQEAHATEAILQSAYRFSPNLETTAAGTITLDLRGLAELTPVAGDEGGRERRIRWGGRLVSAAKEMGMTPRVGIGATPQIARHAARWGGRTQDTAGMELRRDTTTVSPEKDVVIVERPADFLAELPVASLEPSSDVTEILQNWGVRTVGEFLALGQAALAERLGLEALGLFAAASVTATRPLNLVKPVGRFEESHEFETEIETLEPLLFVLRRFVEALNRRLEVFGWVASSLRLRLRLESGRVVDHPLRVPQPTRQAETLFRMLHTLLDGLRTDSPVKWVCLLAEPTRPEQRQFGLFEAVLKDPHQFQETLARLVALVGSDRVGTPIRENSHRADTFTMVPPDFENPNANRLGSGAGAGAGIRFGADMEAATLPDWSRPLPLRRLRPAVLAEVETGDTRERDNGSKVGVDGCTGRSSVSDTDPTGPRAIRCSVAQGRLVVALGPWRSSGHWWEGEGWKREEWDVSVRGSGVYRLVRAGETWQVEGVLD